MLDLLTGAATVTLGVAVASGLLVRRLAAAASADLVSAEWLSRFNVARYRPMERLFAEEDFRFLQRQGGCSARLLRQLRRERIAVFRSYLRSLKSDYRRLESALALYVACSPADRPDLARELMLRRLRFTCAMFAAQFRLRLYGLGIRPADARRLLGVLDDMRMQLRRQALVRQPPVTV